MPEPYHPPEITEKNLENSVKNSEEKLTQKLGENIPKNSVSNSKTPEIYDLETGEKLNFNITRDPEERTFSPTLHVHKVKDGKFHVRTTKTGKLRVNPRAQSEGHKKRVAKDLVKVEQAELIALKETEKKIEVEQEQIKKKESAKRSAGYTAKVLLQGFMMFGNKLFGKKAFKPEHESETIEMHDALVDWLEYHEEIRTGPDMRLAIVFGGYCLSREAEPDSIIGRKFGKKIEHEAPEAESDNEKAS